MLCLFVSDIHGYKDRYRKLGEEVVRRQPEIVFMGGDLLSNPLGMFESAQDTEDFVSEHVLGWIPDARDTIKEEISKNLRVFVIMGNDDPRVFEKLFMDMDNIGIMDYIQGKTMTVGDVQVSGYCFIPPSPFLLKDWEKYDVSRHVDIGSVSPEEGYRTFIKEEEGRSVRYDNMEKEMERLFSSLQQESSIFLFHAPPYNTFLDKADLDGVIVDHAPLDSHVGSIAIRRFIERNQPLITLHGHIHESTRLTGRWKQNIGRTWCFNAAHHGPELCIVSFDTSLPAQATRELVQV